MTLSLQEKVAWLALSVSTLNTDDMVELKFSLKEISDKSAELHNEVRDLLNSQRKPTYEPRAKKEVNNDR